MFDPRSVNLIHFSPRRVAYKPKKIRTEAIQVTLENVGKLCLEFSADLMYSGEMPWFSFMAIRYKQDGLAGVPRDVIVRVGDWLVPLWNELHLFRDREFQNTFFEEPAEVQSHELDFRQEPLPTSARFSANDRVVIRETRDLGTVIFFDGDKTYDVRLDNTGQRHSFAESKLEFADYDANLRFCVKDRVMVGETGDAGTVVDCNVDRGDGTLGYEVQLDNTGQNYVFSEEELTTFGWSVAPHPEL